MPNIESLLNGNTEEFRNEVHAELYSKIKDKLADKKIDVATTMFDKFDNNPPCNDCDQNDPQE